MSLKTEKLNFIKQFAFEQFQKHGFSRVTMDEIAKETNTGKGTLYRYFPSKEELLIAAVQKNISEIEKRIQQEMSNDKDPLEKLDSYILLLSQRLKHVQTTQLLDIERNVPQAYEIICEARERIINKTLTTIFNEGKESGVFRSDLDVDLATKIVLGASEYMTSPKVLETMEYQNLTEMIRKIFYTFLQGCYSEEGNKRSKNF
jgi:AcrR family transcriptional regulator